MARLKILNTFGEGFAPKAKKILAECGSVDYLSLSLPELAAKIADYDILVMGLTPKINSKVIDEAVKLKIIAVPATGLDHIDEDYAVSKGITVLSLRGEKEFLSEISCTAELAFGLIIDIMRKISASAASVKNHQWKREEFTGRTLKGKILGIVGFGRLGKMMAKYGQGFSMEVLAFDPKVNQNELKERNVRDVSFADLLEKSEIISIHVPLTPQTEGMFSEKEFQLMEKSPYLVNTSRGKIVNEIDLLEALDNGRVVGYAADVLAGETEFENGFSSHPLIEYARIHNNVIITPHIGGMTFEAREATDIFIARKIRDFLGRK